MLLKGSNFHSKAGKVEQPKPRREPAPQREQGIAYILDDPERLRELREQMKKRELNTVRQHKGSRGLSM